MQTDIVGNKVARFFPETAKNTIKCPNYNN